MKKKEKIYQLIMTEEQLRLMCDAVEDWHRFLAGQTDMHNAASMLDSYHELYDKLRDLMPLVTPDLFKKYGHGASYGWSGGGCPNKYQRKAIAMSYGIYRQILHYFAVKNAKPDDWNVYLSDTLTCPEQGPLIKIKEVMNEQRVN